MRPAPLALAAIAIALACRTKPEPPQTSEARLSSVSVVATDDAVLRIAGATCAREVGCANIGTGKRFPDAATCTLATSQAADDQIGRVACPAGVSEDSLEQCLADLRGLVCSLPLESQAQVLTCRRSVLCGVDVRRPSVAP